METLFYKNPLLRYYTAYTYTYQAEFPTLVRMHSNKLFLCFLHPQHPAMQEKILSINYKFNTDALSGKRKKGAINLQANSNILEICTETKSYMIRAGAPGKLIEVNELLVSNPELIKDPEGFLAIIMTPLSKVEAVIKSLQPLDEKTINEFAMESVNPKAEC